MSNETKTYATRIAEEAQAREEKALAEMTIESAIISISAAASILGDNDYLAAEQRLYLVAKWLQAQQTKEQAK